ncbi:MAG: hypothetical protein JNK60_20150 [Acidobacteria bacterium]|nr:hypothetical protein [Acidobacteriota bacterium]
MPNRRSPRGSWSRRLRVLGSLPLVVIFLSCPALMPAVLSASVCTPAEVTDVTPMCARTTAPPACQKCPDSRPAPETPRSSCSTCSQRLAPIVETRLLAERTVTKTEAERPVKARAERLEAALVRLESRSHAPPLNLLLATFRN